MFAAAAIHTKNLERHRMPGVCISLIGFSLVFTGVMILGINSTLQNSTGDAVRVAGPTCLTVGGLMVIGGFTAQYLLHKRHKERLRRLKGSRERAKKSVAVISGSSGSAAKYLADGSIEASTPSTSRGRIAPSVTVETILEEEQYYARQRLDVNRLQEAGDQQFLNFSGQSFSFEDSSDEEYTPPSQTRTEAVIEHRKRSDDLSPSKESPPAAGKSRTPSTPSVRESLGGESGLDTATAIRRSTEIVHISAPRPAAAAAGKHLPDDECSEIDNGSGNPDGRKRRADGDGSRSPARNHTRSCRGERWTNRDIGPGSSDSSASGSSLGSIVSERAARNSGSIPDYGRSPSYAENNDRPRSWSNENRSRTGTKSRALSARQRRHVTVDGGDHGDAPSSRSNGSFLKPSTPSALLTTSWIASDADDNHSFVESLSRSSSFTGRDLPSIERPIQYPQTNSRTDSPSPADSPPPAESPSLADSLSLADSQEKIPTDHSHELNGARIPDGRESGSTSPSDASKCSSPKHINGRMNEERNHRVNKPDPDWSGNGDVITADMIRPRKSKGKMTKHNRCKNPRAVYEDYVIKDYTP